MNSSNNHMSREERKIAKIIESIERMEKRNNKKLLSSSLNNNTIDNNNIIINDKNNKIKNKKLKTSSLNTETSFVSNKKTIIKQTQTITRTKNKLIGRKRKKKLVDEKPNIPIKSSTRSLDLLAKTSSSSPSTHSSSKDQSAFNSTSLNNKNKSHKKKDLMKTKSKTLTRLSLSPSLSPLSNSKSKNNNNSSASSSSNIDNKKNKKITISVQKSKIDTTRIQIIDNNIERYSSASSDDDDSDIDNNNSLYDRIQLTRSKRKHLINCPSIFSSIYTKRKLKSAPIENLESKELLPVSSSSSQPQPKSNIILPPKKLWLKSYYNNIRNETTINCKIKQILNECMDKVYHNHVNDKMKMGNNIKNNKRKNKIILNDTNATNNDNQLDSSGNKIFVLSMNYKLDQSNSKKDTKQQQLMISPLSSSVFKETQSRVLSKMSPQGNIDTKCSVAAENLSKAHSNWTDKPWKFEKVYPKLKPSLYKNENSNNSNSFTSSITKMTT